MLEYVKGEIAEITPAFVVIDCNGVGYMLNISLNTYASLQNQLSAKVLYMKLSGKMLMCCMGLATRWSGRCSRCSCQCRVSDRIRQE